MSVLAALLIAAATALAPARSRRRARRVLNALASPVSGSVARPRGGRPLAGSARSLAVGVAVGLAVAVVVGGSTGSVLGGAALGVTVLVARRARAAGTVGANLADAPLVLDLLAAALRAGLSLDAALLTVAGPRVEPTSSALRRVAVALRLGAAPEEAWAPVAALPGLERVARAAARAAFSGARLAEIARQAALDLRATREQQVRLRARRAGVLAVLPLTGCFLPAFVLVGVVPFVVGVLTTLRL